MAKGFSETTRRGFLKYLSALPFLSILVPRGTPDPEVWYKMDFGATRLDESGTVELTSGKIAEAKKVLDAAEYPLSTGSIDSYHGINFIHTDRMLSDTPHSRYVSDFAESYGRSMDDIIIKAIFPKT